MVGLQLLQYSIDEDGNRQEVCVELSGMTEVPVTVSLLTSDATATGKTTLINIDCLSDGVFKLHTVVQS